jgi:16S rRNA processing protein RimM
MPEYILVGRIGRTHGVSGELYVNSLTDNPNRFREGSELWIEVNGSWKKIKVDSARLISGKPVVRIEGIDNPEDARELTNSYVYIQESELEELPEGKYYYFSLIGCRVVDADNKVLGRVVEVEIYPANDVLVIESEKGERCLFPIVREFVKEIDVKLKKIVVEPPEGIFDSSDES